MGNAANHDATFTDALEGLHRGDFSRLERLFDERSGRAGTPQIVEWHGQGRFRDQPKALAEALTCASFLGHTAVAEYLLKHGVNPSGRAGTGLDALHWAGPIADSWKRCGSSSAQRLRSTREARMAAQLGTAIWSAINEPRRDHLQIIEELLNAGAHVEEADYPTGHRHIDAILQRHRSR